MLLWTLPQNIIGFVGYIIFRKGYKYKYNDAFIIEVQNKYGSVSLGNFIFVSNATDEETIKVYTNNFTLVTDETEETRAACNALDKKETIFFVAINYEDGTVVSVYDNEEGFEQWRKKETDKGITFFLYCKKE